MALTELTGLRYILQLENKKQMKEKVSMLTLPSSFIFLSMLYVVKGRVCIKYTKPFDVKRDITPKKSSP